VSDKTPARLLLEVVGSTRPGAELPRSGVLVVGSDKKLAGYVVEGANIAGAHCAIGRTKTGGYAVKDLGSTNGTLLNGRRVETAVLRAGDTLTLGAVVVRVVDPERPDTKVAPARRPDETQELEVGDLSAELSVAAAPRTASVAPRVESTPNSTPSSTPSTAESATPREDARATPLPTVPGYRIERRIGRGGMGDVYLAVQESLARQVALKVLAARFEADREFVRRFQAEARAAAALNHPNVVTVYDVGETGGKHYLSMEYMDKGNLEDRVKNGAKLEEREVLDILRDALSGLVYAESRGIVHRDLKPANLMQNHVGATKIADLGLATHVESEEATGGDKKVFGTPHFLAPEQARGERVDSRTDLYSLGATAYRLLTGKTPFEGKDTREIVRSVLRDEPKPMRESTPQLSDGVVALVDRLMKKEPSQRFSGAAETLREVERLRDVSRASAVSLQAGGPPDAATTKRGSKGGLVAVVLLLGLGAGAWYWNEQRQKSNEPQKRPTNTTGTPRPGTSPHGATDPDTAATGTTPATKPETARSDKPRDKDDRDLQLFEANAKLALLEVMGKPMSPNERREALRSMAAQYQGTSAATEALEKADGITNDIVSAEAERAARRSGIDAVIEKMRAAAKLNDDPPHPGLSFLAMRAVDGQAALRDDPDFVEARKTLETIVSRGAVIYAQRMMSEAGMKLDKGDFEGGRAQLEALMPLFDLPEYQLGEAPAGVSELFEVGRTARERLRTIESARDVFERRRERDDAVAIAAGLGGAAGLERELRSLDFAAAKARLESLLPNVGGKQSLALVTGLVADCERARVVLDTLARECREGTWRRRSFNDPREKKVVTRNATGADASGLLFDGENGAADHVPWSAFGGNTKELSKLFFERLNREWTAEELHGIAALVRMQACVEAVDLAAKMFDGQRKANFTEANQRDLLEAFTTAAQWSTRANAGKDEIAKETEAAGQLATALRQATDGQWSGSIAVIERLLTDYQGTLLVRLLSNGQPIDGSK